MKIISNPLSTLLIAIALFTCGRAEPGVLWVKVSRLRGQPMPNMKLATDGPGGSGVSDARGLLKITLAPQTKPGSWITLQLISQQYAFVSPWDRRVIVPSFENDSENYVRVFITKVGDLSALESGIVLTTAVARLEAASKPKEKDSPLTEAERQKMLADIAREFGFTPEELDRALREWPKKTNDPFEKGMAALYAQNYPEATAELTKSYELREARLENTQREMFDAAFFLGQALYRQGKYRESAEKYRKALTLLNDDGATVNNLGVSLEAAGQYAEAEQLYRRSLAITEKAVGGEHSYVSSVLLNLARLYHSQKKYAEAEPLYKRALEIQEKTLGKKHPDTARSLRNLARIYQEQGRYAEADPLYLRALGLHDKEAVSEDIRIANVILNLAHVYYAKGEYGEAGVLSKRALEIAEKAPGPWITEYSLSFLAEIYQKQGRYIEAETLYKRALNISERNFGEQHSATATVLESYAALLRKMNRDDEAAKLEVRAKEIWAKVK